MWSTFQNFFVREFVATWRFLLSFLEDVLYSDTMLDYLVRCPWSSGLGRPQVDPVFLLNTYRRQYHNQKLTVPLHVHLLNSSQSYNHTLHYFYWWSNSCSYFLWWVSDFLSIDWEVGAHTLPYIHDPLYHDWLIRRKGSLYKSHLLVGKLDCWYYD